MTINRRARTVSAVLAAVTALAVARPWLTRAEVGVVDIERSESYVLGIIDDPDPTGKVWRRYTPPSSDRIVLNEQGETNGDGNPTLAYNRLTGTPIVAWSRNSATGFDVVLSYFSSGAWSEPVALAASPADELDPYLVVDPDDGTVHLLYWIDDGSPRVEHRQAPADLSAWSAPRLVSAPGEIAARPAGTVDQGTLRVVYESHNGELGAPPRLIVLATDEGSGFSYEVVGSSLHDGPNWPQIHLRNGRLWTEWVDGADDMTWTRRDSQGAWEQPAAEPYADTEERDYFVRGRIRARALE